MACRFFSQKAAGLADGRTVYQLGFGVHQWDITYIRLSGLLSKVGQHHLICYHGQLILIRPGGKVPVGPLGSNHVLHQAVAATPLLPPIRP